MATKVPAYTYSGQSSSEVRNGYWYIYLKTNGTLKFTYTKALDVSVVGGGSGGQGRKAGFANRTAGGRGGDVVNRTGMTATAGTGYTVVIGSGGARQQNGNSSSAFGVTASGGKVMADGSTEETTGAAGKYPFGDSSLSRYGANGGAGGHASSGQRQGYAGGADGGGKGGDGATYSINGTAATAGAANTGSGGGGYGTSFDWTSDGDHNHTEGGIAASGGSGVVILRGTEDDFLPVRFNGTQLSKITFNGQAVTGLIYGGKRIFSRVLHGMFRRRAYGV